MSSRISQELVTETVEEVVDPVVGAIEPLIEIVDPIVPPFTDPALTAPTAPADSNGLLGIPEIILTTLKSIRQP